METETKTGAITLEALSEQIGRVERLVSLGAKSVLDAREAAAFTGLSLKHIYRLTSERRIPFYRKNRKIYFKKTELESWLTENKVMSAAEVESRAATYVAIHSNN